MILCLPSVLSQDNMMAKVASLSICFMSAIYCGQNRYSIFGANLPSIFNKHCWKYFLMGAALLSYLHCGSHHHHMGKGLDRLGLQSQCLIKYIWECYFLQVHIDRFHSSSFQIVHSAKCHLLILACG